MTRILLSITMYILTTVVWLASSINAASIRGRRQNLTQSSSGSESGWVAATAQVNSSTKALPMNVCPMGGIVPDQEALKRDIAAGPVFPSMSEYEARIEAVRKVVQRDMKLSPADQVTQQQAPAKTMPHQYVFITGLAYTGTTSIYGLLSTSPKTSNLCAGFGNCCEGAPLLEKAGLWPESQAGNPAYPADWKASLAVYNQFWNMSQPILIEKSVGNMARFPKIWNAVRSMGAKASFIFVVRSTCFFKHNLWPPNGWLTGMNDVLQNAEVLRNAGARVLLVKWEDMVGNPYGVARELLKFLPELVSLDPRQSGLHDAPYVTLEHQDMRAVPAATFSSSVGKVQALNQARPISIWEAKEMEALGYNRQWFETSAYLKWNSQWSQASWGHFKWSKVQSQTKP